MENLVWGLIATLIVSLLSLLGILAIILSPVKIKKLTFWLVSFAVGALLGDVFLHLLPELARDNFTLKQGGLILGGLLLFFVIEKCLAWRHCHIPTSKNHPHPLGMMNLIGDGLHNFLDGLIIGGAFLIGRPLGLATTLAVIFHEIPQEISDFGILIHAGFSRFKALLFNFFSALSAVLGLLIVMIFDSYSQTLELMIVPLTIGGFLYIAGSDLVPELKKEVGIKSSFKQLSGILLGIMIMYSLTLWA